MLLVGCFWFYCVSFYSKKDHYNIDVSRSCKCWACTEKGLWERRKYLCNSLYALILLKILRCYVFPKRLRVSMRDRIALPQNILNYQLIWNSITCLFKSFLKDRLYVLVHQNSRVLIFRFDSANLTLNHNYLFFSVRCVSCSKSSYVLLKCTVNLWNVIEGYNNEVIDNILKVFGNILNLLILIRWILIRNHCF